MTSRPIELNDRPRFEVWSVFDLEGGEPGTKVSFEYGNWDGNAEESDLRLNDTSPQIVREITFGSRTSSDQPFAVYSSYYEFKNRKSLKYQESYYALGGRDVI